jgi:hypothetical protein
MRRIALASAAMIVTLCAFAQEPPARIRLAGVFLQGFSVWRSEAQNCAPPAAKPWMNFDCGFFKCPKPKFLGIPLELDYSNWRQSPRVTEVEVEAGRPFAMHLGGSMVTGTVGDAVKSLTGLPYTLYSHSCRYDVKFTPRPGAMYEATIDPASEGGCFLRLTEIRATDTGNFERVAIDGAELKACGAR